jgi:hypothetical protein
MTHFKLGQLVLAAGALLYCTCDTMADVKITVRYIDVEHEIEPNEAVHRSDRSDTIILTSDHKLRSEHSFGEGHVSSGVPELGNAYNGHTFAGLPYVSVWRIRNGAIIHTNTTPSFTKNLEITTNRIDSRSATVTYRLRRGHTAFEDRRMSNHEVVKMSDLHAENISCNISEINH